MTDVNTATDTAANAPEKSTLYALTGTVAGLSHRTSSTGTPYFVANFTTTLRGKPARIALMGFGKAITNVGDALIEGAMLSLRGSFGKGDKGSRTFTITGPVPVKAPVAA